MKQFIVDRHTTPNTPTLEQVPTEKIPVYNDLDAAVADLANLAVGQLVATKDTGDELSQPVDAVEEGNLHAVTSNAVENAFKLSPIETISITTSNQTAQYDGYLFIYVLGDTETNITVNDESLLICQSPSSYAQTITVPISKGDTFRVNNTTSVYWCKARWYKNR